MEKEIPFPLDRQPTHPRPEAQAGEDSVPRVDRDGDVTKTLPPEIYERLCSTAQVLNMTPEDTLVYAAKHLVQVLLPEQAAEKAPGSGDALPAARRPSTREAPSRKWYAGAGQERDSTAPAQIGRVRPTNGTHAGLGGPDRANDLPGPTPCPPSGGAAAAGTRSFPTAAAPAQRSARGVGEGFPRAVAFFALLTLLPAAAALIVTFAVPRIQQGMLPRMAQGAERAEWWRPKEATRSQRLEHAHRRPSAAVAARESTRRRAPRRLTRGVQRRQVLPRPMDREPQRAVHRSQPARRLAAAAWLRPAREPDPAPSRTYRAPREPVRRQPLNEPAAVIPPQEAGSPPSAEASFRTALERERVGRQRSAEQFHLAEERERISRQRSAEQFRRAEERERLDRRRAEEQFREAERRERAGR